MATPIECPGQRPPHPRIHRIGQATMGVAVMQRRAPVAPGVVLGRAIDFLDVAVDWSVSGGFALGEAGRTSRIGCADGLGRLS